MCWIWPLGTNKHQTVILLDLKLCRFCPLSCHWVVLVALLWLASTMDLSKNGVYPPNGHFIGTHDIKPLELQYSTLFQTSPDYEHNLYVQFDTRHRTTITISDICCIAYHHRACVLHMHIRQACCIYDVLYTYVCICCCSSSGHSYVT